MRAKSAILLLLALGCGLVAAIGVTQVIKQSEPEVMQGDTRAIIVATQDIAPGVIITPQMIKLEAWPADRVPEDALTRIDKVEDCRARQEIFQGEPIREKKVLGKNVTARTPSDFIPEGYVVVGVKVDATSGVGLIRPQDRVDVLVYLRRNPNAGISESSTRTILRNIGVYAVGAEIKVDPATDERDAMPAKTMSLLVTPRQAQVLELAQNLGRVSLVLRPPGEKVGEEDSTQFTAGYTVAELLGSATQTGDRSREDAPDDPTSSGRPDGLLGMVDGMSPGPAGPAVAEVDPSVWTMRILMGPELRDITMEETASPSGDSLWRIGRGGSTRPAPATSDDPAEPDTVDPTPVEPEREDISPFDFRIHE